MISKTISSLYSVLIFLFLGSESLVSNQVENEFGTPLSTFWKGKEEINIEGFYMELPPVNIDSQVTIPTALLNVLKMKDLFTTSLNFNIILIAVNIDNGFSYAATVSNTIPLRNEDYVIRNPELLKKEMALINLRERLNIPWRLGRYTVFAIAHGEILQESLLLLESGATNDDSSHPTIVSESILSQPTTVERDGITITSEMERIDPNAPFLLTCNFKLPITSVSMIGNTPFASFPISFVLSGETEIAPYCINRTVTIPAPVDTEVIEGQCIININEFCNWETEKDVVYIRGFSKEIESNLLTFPVINQ